jgi:16S rRNA (guanine1516-N2)-methyltransferase
LVETARIAVLTEQDEPRSRQLADALDLPLVDMAAVRDGSISVDMLLAFAGSRLEVRLVSSQRSTPLWVDFLGAGVSRRQHGTRRTHPLARAVGRKQPLPAVVDATAGLGRDAFVLANLGYEVVAVERSPILHALLENGLTRAVQETDGGSEATRRLRLVASDAREYLACLPPEQQPDVVYMDPMFPERSKAALVKKEMQFFQQLLGPEADAGSLFEVARAVAHHRVVVKRPSKAAPLAGEPSYRVQGSRVRWDVYLVPGSG